MASWASYPYDSSVILVTGAGSGIGRAIARAFLEHGANVAVCGRTEESLQETCAGAPDDRVLISRADMSSPADIARTLGAVRERWGRIDVVIANAGVSLPGTIDDLDEESWTRMRSINLDGLIALAREVVPSLRETKGSFIAISSVSGVGGDWNQVGYNATKGAVNLLVQSMALDLGRDGVRVNAIAPGFMRTAQTQSRLDDPVFWEALRNRLALDRPGEPDDVARVALFLAGADAAYITGTVIPVDGGVTASSGTPRPPYQISEY